MRILLISPNQPQFGEQSKQKRTVCVALPLLAAYTPPEHEVIIADQLYGDNAFQENIDLVGISAMTSQALHGYKIAEHYRDKGVPVVMGGIHASLLPEEAEKHVDAVCIGEADSLWKTIIEDAAAGRLKKRYKADELIPMELVPDLRHDLINSKRTIFSHAIVQATRGCPYKCDFCTNASMFGGQYRHRPPEMVANEISGLGNKFIFFVDDNIFGSHAYSEKLFKALIPLKIKWVGQASLNSITRDPALLELAKQSGLVGIYVGIESVSMENHALNNSGSKLGTGGLYEMSQKLKILVDNDIIVQASMIFGQDGDDHTVFEKTVDFLKTNRIALASFCILTPYPGTQVYKRYKEEGRLLHEDWSRYRNEFVVFKPKLITPGQLKMGSDWAGRQFYSKRSIMQRSLSNWKKPVIYFSINAFNRHANYTGHGPGGVRVMDRFEKKQWLSSCSEAKSKL